MVREVPFALLQCACYDEFYSVLDLVLEAHFPYYVAKPMTPIEDIMHHGQLRLHGSAHNPRQNMAVAFAR